MTPGGRTAAAIVVLADVVETGRPASDALREWGRKNRFAGSSDRAAIGNLLYASLRRKLSIAAAMGNDSPRALIIGARRFVWGETAEEVAQICNGEGHSPEALSDDEVGRLAQGEEDVGGSDAPDHLKADIPEWLWPEFSGLFGEAAIAQGQALGARPPVDIRVNTLKTNAEKLTKALSRFTPEDGQLCPTTLRFATPEGAKRHPNVEAEASHGRGHFEVQDEGSQIAATLAGAEAGMQVVDYCAGAGGKTLALAAKMNGKGQIHAYDSDRRRLRPLVDRMRRAGVHNIQLRDVPRGGFDGLDDLAGKADLVLVDAPCTGTGIWRRRPEAKWRLRAKALELRCEEQASILRSASRLVRPGGRLVYVTCSILPSENTDQIKSFAEENEQFTVIPYGDVWGKTIGGEAPNSADGATDTLLLTPATHGTDGFFIAVMEKAGGEPQNPAEIANNEMPN